MKRTIFYPNRRYIPPKGTIARRKWDIQEARIIKYELKQAIDKASKLLIANAIGETGGEYPAYLLT